MTAATQTDSTRTTIAGRVVPRIGFGALHLAGPGGWGAPADRGDAISLVRTAVDAGVRYIDTADSLGPDVSEAVLAEALFPYTDDVVIATKAGMLRTGPRGWGILGRPDYLKQQAHASALRLRLDTIPLFYLHRIDPDVPLADQLGALTDLQQDGVIEHIGISAVTAQQLTEARSLATISAVQNHFNLVSRASAPVVTATQAADIPFIAFWSLGHGRTLIDEPGLKDIAAAEGISVAQLLIAWLLARAPHVIALPGSSKPERIVENAAALSITLSTKTLGALEAFAAHARPVPDLPPTPVTPRDS